MDERDITACKYLGEKAVSPEVNGSSSSCRGSDSSGKLQDPQTQLHRSDTGNNSLSTVASSLFSSMANGFSNRVPKAQETLNISTWLCSSHYTTDGESVLDPSLQDTHPITTTGHHRRREKQLYLQFSAV